MYFPTVMDNRSAGGFLSPPNPWNLAEDMVEEVGSDSDGEDLDEDKKASLDLSLGATDECV